jgi:hypothetical protein
MESNDNYDARNRIINTHNSKLPPIANRSKSNNSPTSMIPTNKYVTAKP